MNELSRDWGEASESFDQILTFVNGRDLSTANEAQTRFDVIDRMIRDVLGWKHGQVFVEERSHGEQLGYVDYILTSGDSVIVVEAKKVDAAFPTPTRKNRLKLSGSVLSAPEIDAAIKQASRYCKEKKADVGVVTNGMCWIYFSIKDLKPDSYAYLSFPFDRISDAERLFDTFAEGSVEGGSLQALSSDLPALENRLLSIVNDADARVDRNSIAEAFSASFPAQDNELSVGFDPGTVNDVWSYLYVAATVEPTRLGGSLFEFRDPTLTVPLGINPLPLDQWIAGSLQFILWDPSATVDLQNGDRIFGDLSSFSSPSSIPEPTTLLLCGTGLGVLLKRRRFDLN